MVSFRGDYASKPLVKTLPASPQILSSDNFLFTDQYFLGLIFPYVSSPSLALLAFRLSSVPSFLLKLLWHSLPILPSYCSIQKLSSLPVTHNGSFSTVRWIQLTHSKLHPNYY